jgi:hypothetical protein
MSALSVPGEDADPFPSVPTSEASEGLLGAAEGAVPHLVLSPAERTREALWAASISLEHARVHGPVDSRVTAAYASRMVDNSRRLARCGQSRVFRTFDFVVFQAAFWLVR